MSGTPAQLALRTTLHQIEYVRPVTVGRATGVVREVYGQVEREFGLLAPPIALHSPALAPLAASWALLRETLVATGKVDRATKEAVAAAVSLGNTCPYCVEVHGVVIRGLARGADADAIAADRPQEITDESTRAIASWARASGRCATAYAPPCSPEQVPEVMGVAATFHYLNRMVTVFLPDSPLPAALPGAARRTAQGVLARIMRAPATAGAAPGAAAALLPAAALPADLAWATPSPAIASAFAGAVHAVDMAVRHVLPNTVRTLVHEYLVGWDGNPQGPSRAWVDTAVAPLTEQERPVARLALLTAVTPHQVDAEVVAPVHTAHGDQGLVELTSWAALTAARQISAWTPAATTTSAAAGIGSGDYRPTGHTAG
jgi:AhpD family alkylhydroperoxidase